MHRSYVCLSANRNHWRGNEKSWIRNRCIFSYSLLFLLKRMAVKTFAWWPVLLTLEISLMYWSQLAFDNTCWKKLIRMQETKWSQNESFFWRTHAYRKYKIVLFLQTTHARSYLSTATDLTYFPHYQCMWMPSDIQQYSCISQMASFDVGEFPVFWTVHWKILKDFLQCAYL